jgi:hypothetical protein
MSGAAAIPGTVIRWLAVVDSRSLEGIAYRHHLDDLDRAIAALTKVMK